MIHQAFRHRRAGRLRHGNLRNRLAPHPQTAEKAAPWVDKSTGIGDRAGVGRPMRAAWLAWASKSVALARRWRQVSMMLANKSMLWEPTSVQVP